jgi:hypothetical protein
MNDSELIALVRGSVAEVHATTPLAQVISRGRAVRTRRQIARTAGIGLAGVAAASALAVGLSGVLGATPGAPRPTQRAGTDRAVGFVLTANANGTLTLTMRQMLDPTALQRALAEHGVRALVKTGTYCTSNPSPPAPQSIGVLITRPSIQGSVGLVPAPSQPTPGSLNRIFDHTKTVIDPAAMPAGTELFFGYLPGDQLLISGLIYAHSYTCSSAAFRGAGTSAL